MEHDICDDQKAGIENSPLSQPQGMYASTEDENLKPKSDTLGRSKVNVDEGKVESTEPENHATITDIRSSVELVDPEKICRICHLSSEHHSRTSILIHLGCGCKDELGISHPQCAEAWFGRKGNRVCEICRKTAKNVTGIEDSGFNRVWLDEMRLMGRTRHSIDGEATCWRRNHVSEILLACMIIAFVLLFVST